MNKKFKIFICLIFGFCFLMGCEKEPQKIEKEYVEIKWYNEKSELLKSETVEKGTTISYDYKVSDTKEWDYTFEGWSSSLDGKKIDSTLKADDNTSYYAIVSKEKMKYKITYKIEDEEDIIEYHDYGTIINCPDNPSRDGYRFIAWCNSQNSAEEVKWPITITEDVTVYSKWNEKVDIAKYLNTLISNINVSPYSFLPDSLKVENENNLVNKSDIITNYSNFVDISSIPNSGFGDQWNMVVENIQESMRFFNTLSVVEAISSSVVVAFNNYLDENPSDNASYTFTEGKYKVVINFDGEMISFTVEYSTNIPLIGETTVQIDMHMMISSTTRYVRIQLNDANALKYEVSDNHYKFAIRYLGVRRAMFEVKRNPDQTVEGHINEFLTVSGVGISSAADFYIGKDYVSVVGNKADGIIGFKGYINELYDTKTGNLLGYEVRETLSKLTYNTLWFPLKYVSGINNIKYLEAQTEEETNKIFINNSTEKFESKKVGGLSLKTLSRRFDIEFRNIYYYVYDENEKQYLKVQTKVPMMFVQEEVLDDFTHDMKEVNSINDSKIIVNENARKKIISDYKTLIDIFIINKEKVTEEVILGYIGTKKELN